MLTQRTLQGERPLEMSSTVGRRRQFLSSKASQQPCLCGHEFKKQNTPVTSTHLVERLLIFSVTIDNNGQHSVYNEERLGSMWEALNSDL